MSDLSRHFIGVSVKQLSAVETQRHTSNQHEFNGTVQMKGYLGLDRKLFSARFIYVGVDDEDRLSLDDEVTWYDARERHPTRSEYRLYFRDNEVMNMAGEGDMLIAALHHDGSMLLVVVSGSSPDLGELLWLFGVSETPGTTFKTVDPETVHASSKAIFHSIAEDAGIELEEEEEDNWLEIALSRFGPRFPTTRALSQLALESLNGCISPIEAPDEALLCLMDREEAIFRQLERHIVAIHLKAHAASWEQDVEAFVKFSLGVHNRRKSRAGHALENHLEWLFAENAIVHERGARTENRSKPDFLFPGADSYHDPDWPEDRLTMLGVKTSCKDRWRQVLNEAHRIPEKHLLTLQPGISGHQLDEMQAARLNLVIPRALHSSYAERERSLLMGVDNFLDLVRGRQ